MLHRLRQTRPDAVAGLMTTMNEEAGRVAMHAVREELLRAQAAALGLPLHLVPIPSPCPNEIYQARMAAFVRSAVAGGFTHVAFGDLFLEDVRRYREDSLRGSGLEPLFPLWGEPTAALARQIVGADVRAYLTCVDPRAIDRGFAGRPYDGSLLADLPAAADPCGENGEFHTFVWDGPMFRQPIPVAPGVIVERDGFVFADLVEATEPDSARVRLSVDSELSARRTC